MNAIEQPEDCCLVLHEQDPGANADHQDEQHDQPETRRRSGLAHDDLDRGRTLRVRVLSAANRLGHGEVRDGLNSSRLVVDRRIPAPINFRQAWKTAGIGESISIVYDVSATTRALHALKYSPRKVKS